MQNTIVRSLGRIGIVAATLAIIGAPDLVLAQRVVQVGPAVGAYLPIGRFNNSTIFSTEMPSTPSELRGVAWGARGRLWLQPSWGVQVQAMVSSRHVGGGVFVPSGGVTSPRTARITMVDAEAIYRPSTASWPVWLGAGLGVIDHGGSAYGGPGVEGQTSLTGTVVTGIDWHLSKALVATLGATAWLYPLGVRSPFGQRYEGGFQVDIVPFVSMAWQLDAL